MPNLDEARRTRNGVCKYHQHTDETIQGVGAHLFLRKGVSVDAANLYNAFLLPSYTVTVAP